jgi:clan AA aspartic protease (TIGR02281 family)
MNLHRWTSVCCLFPVLFAFVCAAAEPPTVAPAKIETVNRRPEPLNGDGIPDYLSGATIFLREKQPEEDAVAAGRTDLKIVEAGVVFLQVSFDPGGNSGGNWKPEARTLEQLKADGWVHLGTCAWSPTEELLARMAKAGEDLQIRTAKYKSPKPIVPVGPVPASLFPIKRNAPVETAGKKPAMDRVPAAATGKPKTPAEVLADKGIRKVGSVLNFAEENEFSKLFRDAAKLKLELTVAVRELHAAESHEAQVKRTILDYTQQRQLLRQQLNATSNTLQYNNIVNRMNELGDRLTQLSQTDLSKQTRTAQERVNQAREAYVQHLLGMEELAEEVKEKYATLATDPEVKDALVQLNKETGKTYELVESRGFQTNLRSLQKLQDTVISEKIPLRDDGSNTFEVSVVFNGKHTRELVLDSGASLISLPHKMAVEMGLEPGSSAPILILSLADGSMVEGRQITIPEVRVGKFIVENVEGAVLPPSLSNAPALLGMSYLKNFDFKIDSAAKTLTMTKVDGDDLPSRSTPTRSKRPPQ